MSTRPDDTLNRDKIYQNSPLVGQQIRLLTIQPGAKDDPIKCNLSVVDWKHLPEYEALSYAWGSPTEQLCKIRLDGTIIFVTRNLRNALSAFRHVSEPRVLWVDALCINQYSTAEKSRQIRLMDQIYSRAILVKIWLGEESEPEDAQNEPVFLRDLISRDSRPVFLETFTYGRETGRVYKHFRRAVERRKGDELCHRSSDTIIALPRPFHFSMEVNVAAEVEDLLALLDGHRRCKSNDTWVQDGAKDDNVAITFCWLHAWARNAHVTGLAVLEDFCYRRNILKVLSAITRRPWWNRTWTIQEIGLAQKSDVVLGGLGAPWGMLTAAAANIVTHRLNCCTAAFAEFAVGEVDVILEFCRKVLDIENTRRLCKSESSPQPSVTGHTVPPTIPISQNLWLLWFTRPREAFDARDKIFGLRGVMKSWSAGLPIEPDYSKPAQNVFRDLTTALIDQTKGYDVLIGNLGKSAYPELPQWLRNLDSLSIDMPEFTSSGQDQHPNEHPELVQLKRLAEYSPSYVDQVPSWVPDFAAPASTFERERVDRASLYSASSASVAPPPRILAGIALEVHTLPVDRIKHVGPVMIVAREASFNPILKQWVNLMICDAAERGYDLKSLGDRDYLNGGNMICAWQRTICMDSIPTTDAQVGQTTRYRRPDDYADALTHQRWAEGILDADDYDAIFGLRTGLNAKIPAPPGDSETALFGASVKSATFLRCFFITERGYFGLGPSQARVGDEVKVFLGGRVPFLVRAIGAASVPAVLSAQADACFSLVGDCFLQGIMDGERPLQAVRRGEECQACYLI